VLVLATCAVAVAADTPPPEYMRLARELLAELVAIDTTHERGTTRAAEALAARLRAAGFPAEDIRVLGPEPHKMNLVVRVRGRGDARPILFLSHLDVVAAQREDWSYDPFRLTEEDGWFYGRGTLDIKGECADLVTNLIRLREEGYVPHGDIIVALTDDEETGGDTNGAKWLLEHHRDLIDAAFVVNTDAAGGQIEHGVRVRNPVQTAEKSYVTYAVEATNPGGHSSMPREDNAIYSLARALARFADYAFPVRFTDTTRAYVQAMAASAEGAERADLLAAASDPPDPDALARLVREPLYNAMLRTTCVATTVQAGHAENALAQRARATIQCRLLPGDDIEQTRAAIVSALSDPALSVTVVGTPNVAPGTPLDPAIIDAVRRVTEGLWPGVAVLPVMDVWSTDGVYFRRAGYPVYGVSGIFFDVDDVRSHGRDERIRVESFYEGVEFMYRLMKELTGGAA
jgi:acetylornithine deacetylase/succinyl-diaminopimelate desuccinylase-like protein